MDPESLVRSSMRVKRTLGVEPEDVQYSIIPKSEHGHHAETAKRKNWHIVFDTWRNWSFDATSRDYLVTLLVATRAGDDPPR
jgi:hypothetical protein